MLLVFYITTTKIIIIKKFFLLPKPYSQQPERIFMAMIHDREHIGCVSKLENITTFQRYAICDYDLGGR